MSFNRIGGIDLTTSSMVFETKIPGSGAFASGFYINCNLE